MLAKIPNVLTTVRIILTPIFVYLFLRDTYEAHLQAAVIFFIASLTDWYDGYLARKMNYITRVGQFYDPIADKILVSSALAVFAYMKYIYIWIVVIIVSRDILVTGLRFYALYLGKVIITSSFAKWKTFIQMGFVFALLIYLIIPGTPEIKLSFTYSDYYLWTTIAALLVVLLTVLSGIHYVIYNRSHIIEIFKRLADRLFQ